MATPSDPDTTLSSLYWVKEQQLTEEEKHALRRELFIRIKDFFNPTVVTEFTLLYKQRNFWGVPRFYGLRKFGNPDVTLLSDGDPLNPDIKFVGELKESHHQITAVNALMEKLKPPAFGGMLCLPCGFGKTVVALYAALQLGRKTLVVIPNTGLMQDWRKTIEKLFPGARIGIIQQSVYEIKDKDIVLGMVHSVGAKQYPGMHRFGTVILDEAHHMAARTFSKTFARVKAKYVIGLSATPNRSDGLEHVLHWYMGPIAFQASRRKGERFAIKMLQYHGGKQKEVRNKCGKLVHMTMYKIISKDSKRNAIITDEISRLLKNPKRQIGVFSHLVGHLDILYQGLVTKGVPPSDIGFYTGRVKLEDRKATRTKRVILATIRLGVEGFDVSTLNTIVLALPLGNKDKIKQLMGRALRLNSEQECTPYMFDIWDQFSSYVYHGISRRQVYDSFDYNVTII